MKQDAEDLRSLWCGVAALYAEVLSVFGVIVFLFHFPVFLVQSYRKRRVLKKYTLPFGVALAFPPMVAFGLILIPLFVISHP